MKWSKKTEKFYRERRVWSTCFAHFWLVPEGDIGCFLAFSGRYKPQTSFCHKPYEVTVEPQSRAPHLLCAGHVIYSHKYVVELVKYSRKTCWLGEQRTRAPSILTLSWKILDEPPRWKVVAESRKDARILGLQRRRIQPGARVEAWSFRAFV